MMLEQIAKNLVMLKQEFTQLYHGHSHIQELIPISTSESFPINDDHLELLHNFATKNPIYHNVYESQVKTGNQNPPPNHGGHDRNALILKRKTSNILFNSVYTRLRGRT